VDETRHAQEMITLRLAGFIDHKPTQRDNSKQYNSRPRTDRLPGIFQTLPRPHAPLRAMERRLRGPRPLSPKNPEQRAPVYVITIHSNSSFVYYMSTFI